MIEFILLGIIAANLKLSWDLYKLERKNREQAIALEQAKNLLIIVNARSVMCRNKLEMVESGLDALLVEKFSQSEEVIQ